MNNKQEAMAAMEHFDSIKRTIKIPETASPERRAYLAGLNSVNHPKHYNAHPSGIECIQVVEHMNFCRGNAVKYIWRAGEKGDELEDLKKARWYIDREIERLEKK